MTLFNSEMNRKRVEKSIELLRVLDDSRLKYQNIITGDEAWLQWAGKVMGKWQKEGEAPPVFPRIEKTIKKPMIIVFFSFREVVLDNYLSYGV